MNGTKIIYLRRKLIAAGAFALAAVMMFWVVNHPAVVGASASTRQLPIYCVQKDYKVLSISFDAAWGDVILRRALTSEYTEIERIPVPTMAWGFSCRFYQEYIRQCPPSDSSTLYIVYSASWFPYCRLPATV